MGGEGLRAAGPGTDPASFGRRFALTFVDGRAVLGLEGRALPPLGRVDRLEMEIPGLRFPFDFSGGPSRFQRRRCRLRALGLSAGAAELSAFLREQKLADFGIEEPRVTVAGAGELRLEAHAQVGGHGADFTVRAALTASGEQGLRIALYDVRVYGFLPVAAPLLASALFAPLGVGRPGTGLPPLVRLEGPTDARLELLELALLGILPAAGWRLPERAGVRAVRQGADAEASASQRLSWRYAPGDEGEPWLGSPATAHDEGRGRHQGAEQSLARGELEGALEVYRRVGRPDAGDAFATTRLLQLLVAAPGSAAEAEALAAQALARWQDFVPALLARAAVASQAGRWQEAAALYRRLAALAEGEGSAADQASALVALAREQRRATGGGSPPARPLAEAEAADGDEETAESLRLAGEIAARRRKFPEAARLLEKALARTGDPAERAAIIARLAELLGGPLHEPAAARALLEQALVLAPCDAGLLDHLGELLAREGVARVEGTDTQADWEPYLRSALEQAGHPEERLVALTRMRDLGRGRDDPALLAEALLGLVEEGGPESLSAALELAARAQNSPAIAAETIETLRPLLVGAPALVGSAEGAELAYRLAGLLEQRRDEDGALVWLRACLEGAARGEVATAAWRRFVEIAARRGDATAAAQALVAWADDPRTAEDERARAIHLVAAAEIFRERLGLVEDAVALLERAISLAPRDEAAFEALETLATRTGDWPRLAELLARRAELVRPAERNALWGRLGALLAGKLAREEDAARLYQRLLDAEPGHPEALLFIARFAWKQGGQARSAEHYQRLLEAGGDGRQRAEAHLRLAQWAAVGGALAEARQHADQALAGEPEEGAPAEVLVAALEALGQGEELVERLARRETRAGEPRAPGGSEEPRSELARLRAGVLDRLGGARSEEAVQIYQELLAADGSAPLALLGLARIFRRQERWPELLSVLERLWAGERMTPIDVEAVGLELASVLAQQAGQPERAEAILRELVVRSPGWLARVEGAGGAAPLPAEMQARIHFTLGQVAERDGDLPSALEHFEAALSSGSSPKERARHLLGHARVRLLGKEVEDARTDLAEALDLVPEYAPALALLADLAYRNQDWPEARRLYTRLAAAPDVAQAIAADLLLFRRALLAEAGGDDVEAEAAYRALCALDPAHCEAREGLAQIAFLRGDLPEAARLLEEVLRLRSPEARERIRAARQRLGEIYFRMHDYAAARPLLEQVLAEQPDHGEGIGEALVAVYQRLGLDAEASALHARLARIHPRLEQRPDALARLVPYYWSRGDFTGLCEVGEELQRIPGPGPLSRRELALTVALGTAMAGQDTETAARILLRTTTTTTTAAGGAEAGPGEGPRIEAEEVAARLADLGTRLSGRDVKGLDPALDLLARAVPGSLGPSLLRALGRRAMAPAAGRDPGALVALGRVAERRGNRALARVAYGVLCSVDPASPAGARLAALGPGGAVRPEGFAPGAVDHPAVRGPLRRVLRALCRPLAGLGRISARSKVTGMGVPAEAAARLEELRGKLDAPPVRAVFQTEVTGAVALGTRPVTIALGPGVMELPPEEAAFVMARALEDARAGTFLARALDGEPSDDDLSHLLAAVRACLGGGAGGASELDRTVAGWLAEPETAALLPAGTGMVQLLADLDEVASGPVDLGAYLRGCRLTADRVGLLACGSPAVALRVLASETDAAGAESARELIAFLLSPEYAGLMGELAVER